MNLRTVICIFAYAAISFFVASTPSTAQVELVSSNAMGTDTANGRSGIGRAIDPHLVSADGRFVAFDSIASDLGPTDTNGQIDAYLRDRQLGTTTLISVNMGGTDSGNFPAPNMNDPRLVSRSHAITPDGRYVLFASTAADLVPLFKNSDLNDRELYLRDTKKGTTELVSVNLNGTGTGDNGISRQGVITPDGRFVSFVSFSANLVAASIDINGRNDVFRRDLQKGTTTLVSVNPAGVSVFNAGTVVNDITPDGRYVLFSFNDDGLVPLDNNGATDVFVRDLKPKAELTTLVSVNHDNTGSGDLGLGSGTSSISNDGSLVVFTSFATDLVSGGFDGNGFTDVFVRNLSTGITTVLTVNESATNTANNRSFLNPASISGNSRFVLFQSTASDITADTDVNSASDLFVHDLSLGTNTLVSEASLGSTTGNGSSNKAFMSEDGRFVVFQSRASDLQTAITDDNGRADIYIRDLQLGTTELLSTDGIDVGNDNSEDPRISANGRTIAFESEASNLASPDTNGGSGGDEDVFVHTIQPADILHDLAVPGGGFLTAQVVLFGGPPGCGPDNCLEDVTIRIKNLGDHDEASVPFEVTVVSGGAVAQPGCIGDAGFIASGAVVTVGGCKIKYTAVGTVDLLLTVSHPDSGSLDQDLSNNTANTDVNVM